MVDLRVFLCRSIAFALYRHNVDNDRPNIVKAQIIENS